MAESKSKEDFSELIEKSLSAANARAKVRASAEAHSVRTTAHERFLPPLVQNGDLAGAVEDLLSVEKKLRIVRTRVRAKSSVMHGNVAV